MSVALFAPGWTWECADKPANDFVDRETRFWTLLQPWLVTHGVSVTSVGVDEAVRGLAKKSERSVFRSCFGLGLGHTRGQPAQKSSPPPWFNLKMMEFQPSFCSLEDGMVSVVENRTKLKQPQVLSVTLSTNASTTLPILLVHMSLRENTSLLVTMLVKRRVEGNLVEGVGVRLGTADGKEETMEEVSEDLVERRKLDFGLHLDEEQTEDDDWVERAFVAEPSCVRVVDKLGVHLPAGLRQVQIASINLVLAML